MDAIPSVQENADLPTCYLLSPLNNVCYFTRKASERKGYDYKAQVRPTERVGY